MFIILLQNSIGYFIPIRMGKFQPLKIPDAGEGKEQQELSLTLVGMQNGTGTLGDSLAISYKTQHTLTIPPRNHTPWYPNELKVCVPTENCMYIWQLYS